MSITSTEEFKERVKLARALRPDIGIIEAKRIVRKAMLIEELRAISTEPTDPVVWRLAKVIEEILDDPT